MSVCSRPTNDWEFNMHYATSPDLGLTWSPVQDVGFKGHAPHLYRLSTGEIVLTHRVPATSMHVTRDKAKTWLRPYRIDTVGGAYPATVELKDGRCWSSTTKRAAAAPCACDDSGLAVTGLNR